MRALENLGLIVKKKRGERAIRETAKEIGISHATLSRVERGHLPDLENYNRICKWLGVEPVTSSEKNSNVTSNQVLVHFRKSKTTAPVTAAALANLILAADAALAAEE